MTDRVAIHYRRIPDRLRIYDQRVVTTRDDVVVTLSEPIAVDEPMRVDGRLLLERDSLAVWFTFPGAWHDIGRFHAADGRFTGLYANVITPVIMEGAVWDTTDLFLDVWWPDGGAPHLLDEDEFEEALESGSLDTDTAERARREASRILDAAARSAWPPPVVNEWTLERALRRLGPT